MANSIETPGVNPEFSSAPADDYVPVTKANGDQPNGKCRGLTVLVAGTLNLTNKDGVERDGVKVFVGYNPLVVKQVRLGGTADGIQALY